MALISASPKAPATVPIGGTVKPIMEKPSFLGEMARLKALYETDIRNKCYRALIYGPSGTGKTTSLRTARFPLLVHSFDPGGAKSLSDLVESGDAFVDSAYENEDPKHPVAFREWDIKFTALRNSDVFKSVGTYILDSATTWAQCAMYEVLKKANRLDGVPQQNDWYPQMNLIELAVRQMLTLPCDVILIAHDTADKDDISGRITRAPLFTGKLTKRLPILFDEVYYSTVQQKAKGPEYVWQTAADASNEAKSRLAAQAVRRGQPFGPTAPQNFKEIMAKAGLPTASVVHVETEPSSTPNQDEPKGE